MEETKQGGTPQQTRNIAIIGNIETGKVTLLNALLKLSPGCPEISPEDEVGMYIMRCNQFTYNDKTIKANYICSRGKLGFIDEINSILRVVDGAFVVIDAIEGISVLVQMALQKCIQQRIEPIIVINKIDNLLIYVKYDQKQFYDIMIKIVGEINSIMKSVEGFQCNIVDNLIYSSLKYGIILNKKTILDIILKNQTQVKKINKQKWLNFDQSQENKEWTLANVVEPVCMIMKEKLKLADVSVNEELACSPIQVDDNLVDAQQIADAANQWFSPSDVLRKAIVNVFPSPQQSQPYRAQLLYTGDIIDPCGQGILKCSPDAPLMMYVTNAINDPDNKNNIYRLARIYSGTLTKGDKVKILDRKYKFGSKSNILYGAVKLIMQPFNGVSQFLEKAVAGSLVCITGVDHKIVRAATITTFDLAHPIAYLKSIQKRIASFIRCEPEHYDVMLEALKQLSRRRQGLRYKIEETGEAYVLGSSIGAVMAYIEELKLQLAFEIKASEPFVRVKETITQPSTEIVMSKSTNKQNRVYLSSFPIEDDLCKLIENGELRFYGDKQARNERLVKEFNWDAEDAIRIWGFGPDQRGPNILVDKTDHPSHLSEVKDSILTGFNLSTWHGALLQQPLRGVRINLNNIQLAQNKQQRLSGEIIRAMVRCISGCQLISAPALLQPIFLCEIKIKGQQEKEIEQMIRLCRGKVIGINDLSYKKIIDAYIPAIEKKVFEDRFMGCSYSMEYFQSIYHHDEIIENFSLEQGSPTYNLLMSLRKKKGLPEYIPNKHDYIDKL